MPKVLSSIPSTGRNGYIAWKETGKHGPYIGRKESIDNALEEV
jgi:hypothetical protein